MVGSPYQTIDNLVEDLAFMKAFNPHMVGNVVMPNLSPVKVRKKYALYDNKICTGEEAAECRGCLGNRMESIGYKLVVSRGDSPFV